MIRGGDADLNGFFFSRAFRPPLVREWKDLHEILKSVLRRSHFRSIWKVLAVDKVVGSNVTSVKSKEATKQSDS